MEGDNVQNVAATADPGAGGTPNPPASNDQQATIEGEAQKLFDALAGKFDERFTSMMKPYLGQLEGLKKVQGDVDRSQKTLKEQFAQLQKYKEAGLSDDEAIAEMEADAKADEWKSGIENQLKQLVQLVSGGASPNTQQTAASVFQKFGLDPKDPRVAPELAKTYKSTEEMEVAALKKFHEIQTSPNPSAAQLAAMNGGGSQQQNKRDISNINDSATLYDIAAQDITAGK